MGLFSFIKSELINIIEWTDSSKDTMVYRFPVHDNEIKMGAQLTVRESQVAVFVNEGKIADIFEPGRYELDTKNMPLLTTLKSWKYGFNSPFKAEIYFVNTKLFNDQKWGTSNPIMMRDQEFGMIRLRGYGMFSFRVNNPEIFLKDIFGTNASFETDDINKFLKRIIVSGISDLIAESNIAALDLAMNYDELSVQGKEKFQSKFNEMGFELKSFYIENLSLPEEVEAVMDKRTSMGVLGDLGKYTQYQAAEAIRDAAQNEGGGLAGAGVGMGAGLGLGNMMAGAMSGMNQQQPAANQQPATSMMVCPKCNAKIKDGSKFCPECGEKIEAPSTGKVACVSCAASIKEGSKFCPECGAIQKKVCSNCNAELKGDARFCPECGTKA